MHVQRYQPQRRGNRLPLLTCGCLGALGMILVIGVVGTLILLPALPGIAAQVVGFSAGGSVDDAFASVPPPAPALQDPAPVAEVRVDLGVYGSQVIGNNPQLYDFSIGTVGGAQAMTVNFTESGILELCRQRTNVCGNENPQYRNVTFDLRPGGVVAYADATIPQLGGVTQRIGAVMRVDGTGRRLEFVGLDINGSLFTNPPPELASLITPLEQGANEVLTSLSLSAGGAQYALSRISITDTDLTLFLQ